MAGDFLQGLREEGSARGCGNVLWKDFKPNPRLVTKCKLRGAASVPAAFSIPSQAWLRELELLGPGQGLVALVGSFPREALQTPFGWEGICFWPREVEGWERLLWVPELEHEVGAMGSW